MIFSLQYPWAFKKDNVYRLGTEDIFSLASSFSRIDGTLIVRAEER